MCDEDGVGGFDHDGVLDADGGNESLSGNHETVLGVMGEDISLDHIAGSVPRIEIQQGLPGADV